MKSFLEKASAGEAYPDEIEDYVQSWHEGGADCSLADYLGMSETEYALWVEKPASLDPIIRARSEGMRLEKIG